MSDGYLVTQKRRDPKDVDQQKIEEKRKKKASYKFTLHSKVWQPDKVHVFKSYSNKLDLFYFLNEEC